MKNEFEERFSRHFPLSSIGKEGQLKLRHRRVLIAGMGGLGTVSAELLASIGVGFLRIVDFDVVERSNLPRQKLYNNDDIGKAKVEVAKERLEERYPDIEIEADTTRIDALSARTLLQGIDVVVDGLDKFSTRKALYRVARKQQVPFVFTGAVAEQANLMVFTHQPDQPCMDCVLGNVGDDPEQSCEIRGVHPSILSIAGAAQVSEVIKLLLDRPSSLEGTMLYIDLLDLSFDKIKFTKREKCKFCGEQDSDVDELDEGEPGEVTKGIRQIGGFGNALVTSLCGRDTKIIDPNWDITWQFEAVRQKLAKEYHFAAKGEKYITINIDNIGVSILDSGVTTIRGAKTTKRAISTFESIYEQIKEM